MKFIHKLMIVIIIGSLSHINVNSQIIQYWEDESKGGCIDCLDLKNRSSTDNGCFCEFTTDIRVYDANVNYALLQKVRQLWLTIHENRLKNEINERTGQNFQVFADAQAYFFRHNFVIPNAVAPLTDLRNQYRNQRGQNASIRKEKKATRRVFDIRYNDAVSGRPSTALGDLTFGNNFSRVADLNASQAANNRNAMDAQINQAEADYNNSNRWAEFASTLSQLNNNDFQRRIYFSNLTQEFVRHYNNRSYEERIRLMTAYLIVQNNYPNGYPHDNPFFENWVRENGINFFRPDYRLLSDNYIRNNAPSLPNSSPEISDDEALITHALATTFTEYDNKFSNPSLRKALKQYLEYHNYKGISLNHALFPLRRLASKETYAHPFLKNRFVENSGRYVNPQNPGDKVYRIKTTNTIGDGSVRLGDYLKELFRNNRLSHEFALEGAYIRSISGFGGIENMTVDEEQLGRMFDFDQNRFNGIPVPEITINIGRTDFGYPEFSLDAGRHLFNGRNMNNAQIFDATMLTLALQNRGTLNNSSTNFDWSIVDYYAINLDLTDPATVNSFIIWYSTNFAILKLEHGKIVNGDFQWDEGWSDFRATREILGEGIHLTLDLLGLVPVIGIPIDLVNGAFYALEGDMTNASLSVVSAIPVAGWVSAGTKLGIKVIVLTASGGKTGLKWIVKSGGLLDFGDSSQLRRIIGLKDTTKQAHHILSWELRFHRTIQKAANAGNTFHMNEFLNGIGVKKWRNQPNHHLYTARVNALLDAIPNNLSNADTFKEIKKIIEKIRKVIEENPDLHLNDIIF